MRRIADVHVGGDLVVQDEARDVLLTGIEAQLQEQVGHSGGGFVHRGDLLSVSNAAIVGDRSAAGV